MSGGNDVTLDRVNFRPAIKQNIFLKKISTPRVCVALKAIWSYCILINIKLPRESKRTSVVFKEHLVAFSLTFVTYALKLNLQSNISFSSQKSAILFTILEEKLQQYTNGCPVKIELKEDFLMLMSKLPVLYKHEK